ncbi:MAG: lytic transglycosylase domain-containing protein [Acetobacteraceae bacterium]|nr:lytic transglycosylase domain-containing protein [Acetobacteraceae bacterium]
MRPLLSGLGALSLLAAAQTVDAQPAPSVGLNPCRTNLPEAAARSGLSPEFVLRVMAAESGGNPRAVSAKGAMGCMQIMPATWTYLSGRYGIGPDPYDPRQNMIAGAAYLAELTTRYGFPGAIAAYNAGPARYERYVAGRGTLPSETIAYAARIGRGSPQLALLPSARWQEAGLFLIRAAQSPLPDAASVPTRNEPRRGSGSLFPLASADQHGAADPARP